MIKPEDVEMVVEFTEGYRQKYTLACLKRIDKYLNGEVSLKGSPAKQQPDQETAS